MSRTEFGESTVSRSSFGEGLNVEPVPVAGWTFAYTVIDDLIKSTTANGGTITTSNGRALLQTSTANNGSAKIQTKRVLRYTPGQGGLARFTAVFPSGGKADSSQIIGVGDANDGFFFGYNGADFGILLRAAGVDTWVYQSAWNVYPFIEQGEEIDLTKGNVFQIKYQWLGYGAIRFYIEWPDSGEFREVHRIRYANTNANTSVRNPTFPMMAQVVNAGNTSNLQLLTPSAMIFNEGPVVADVVHPLSALRSFSSIVTVNGEDPVLAVRSAASFQSLTSRIESQLVALAVATDGNKNVTLRIYKDGTLTGGSFVNFDAGNSGLSANATATSLSGGTQVATIGLGKASDRDIPVRDLGLFIYPGETLTITAASSLDNEVTVGVVLEEHF